MIVLISHNNKLFHIILKRIKIQKSKHICIQKETLMYIELNKLLKMKLKIILILDLFSLNIFP